MQSLQTKTGTKDQKTASTIATVRSQLGSVVKSTLETNIDAKQVSLLAETKKIPVLLNEGENYERRNPIEALHRYEAALRLDSKLAAAHHGKGNVLCDLGYYKEGLTSYDTALACDSKRASTYTSKGHALSDLGEYEEALTCYQTASQLEPKAISFIHQAATLRCLERDNESLACYEAALQKEPKNAAFLIDKGITLKLLGRSEEALACAEAALICPRPTSSVMSHKLFIHDKEWPLRVQMGRVAYALPHYEAVLAKNPEDAQAQQGKGMTLVTYDRPAEALACFGAALALDPSYAMAYYNQGVAFYNLNRPTDALVCFEAALALNPRYGLAHYGRGTALVKLGSPVKALVAFDAALRTHTNFELVLANCSKLTILKKVSLVDAKASTSSTATSAPTSVIATQGQASTTSTATTAVSLNASYQIPYAELQLGEKLGKGGFGIVYKATWRLQPAAVKVLRDDKPTEATINAFKTEMQIMASLRAPNIVTFYGCVLGNPTYGIVMEYMPKGSLYSVLHSSQTLDWPTRYKICLDIAGGLAFLHASHVLHRDLKSLNILLDENYRAKLTDFGLAKIKTRTRTRTSTDQMVGTYGWIAPELTDAAADFTPQCDIFSLGVVLWEITTRKLPYETAVNPAFISFWYAQNKREDIPADCPPKLAHLIKLCWDTDPNKRPNAAQVVQDLKAAESDFKLAAPVAKK
jgi:tetratricopeptide (TPR) repeat protein